MLHNGAPRENKGLILPVFPCALQSLLLFFFLNFIPLFFNSELPIHSLSLCDSHPLLLSTLTHVSLSASRSSTTPPLSLCISCIVNSSQKHDKVSAHVPPAFLSVLPAICYCLPAIVCLSLSSFLYSVFPLRQKSKS